MATNFHRAWWQISSAFLLAFTAALPTASIMVREAEAKDIRAPPSACVPAEGAFFDDSAGAETFTSNGSWTGDDDGTDSDLVCPYVELYNFVWDHNDAATENAGLRRTEVTSLNVYISDNDAGNSVGAMACWSSFSSATGSCGTLVDTGAGSNTPGFDTLTPPVRGASGVWDDTTIGVAYIYIGMGGNITFEGFYASD